MSIRNLLTEGFAQGSLCCRSNTSKQFSRNCCRRLWRNSKDVYKLDENAYPKSVEVGNLLERVITVTFVELNLISAFVLADFKRIKLHA